MNEVQRSRTAALGPGTLLFAVAGPIALTAALVAVNPGNTDYIFLYLAVVAILGITGGLRGALIAASASFLLVDYFFVSPIHTLEFAKGTDLLNLCVFFGAAGLVGTVGSRRRDTQLRAERLAADLQAANVDLARLAETERQVRDLEETDRLRREVLANVSHELRTPLASILTGITSLRRKTDLTKQIQDDVASLATEARRLDRLVTELLDMTRIEGGVVDIRADELDIGEAMQFGRATTSRRTAGASR